MLDYLIFTTKGGASMLVDVKMYQFLNLNEEEKSNNVITKLTVDVTGVKLNNEKEVVRIENILFIPRKAKPETLADYKAVDIVFPDLTSLVDEEQVEKIKKAVFALYRWSYLQDNEVRSDIDLPDPDIIF